MHSGTVFPIRSRFRPPLLLAATWLAVLGAAQPLTVLGQSDEVPSPNPSRSAAESPDSEMRRRGDTRTPYNRSRSVVYFPPVPPRLRAPLSPLGPLTVRRPAPAELAEFVNEPFYAPLSTQLANSSLTEELRQRLLDYHVRKTTLQHELIAKYDSVEALDSGARERELIAFSSQQSAAIAELEVMAESLREDLIRGRDDWNARRQWRLGMTRFRSSADAMMAQFMVIRAAAYYQKALSPAQRRLVRELAMDLMSLGDANVIANYYSQDSNPLLAFSPATARIRLPSSLPPELAGRIAEFEQRKAQLKQELRDLIYEQDDTLLPILRNVRFESLARDQAPRIAALEGLAEEIRRELAPLMLTDPPQLPAIPAGYAERLSNYFHARDELQASIADMVREIQQVSSLERVALVRKDDGRFEMRVVLEQGPLYQEAAELVRMRLNAFNQAHAARVDHLASEIGEIRQNLIWLTDPDASEDTVRTIDRLLEEFGSIHEVRLRWQRYREYQIATLEPGLSPEQRRLLYDGALVRLRLPLPEGDLQPIGERFSRR